MMAEDPIKSLNLLSQLRSYASDIRRDFSAIGSSTASWGNSLSSALGKLRGFGDGGGVGGGPASNQVAPYPVFTVTSAGNVFPPGGGPDSNLVFRPPYPIDVRSSNVQYGNATPINNGGGGRNFAPGTGLFAAAAGSMAMMPTTKEAVEMQLGTSRMVFYQQQAGLTAAGLGRRGPDGQVQPFNNNPIAGFLDATKNSQDKAYKEATVLLQEFAKRGTMTSKQDALKAFEALRQYGIAGPNQIQVALGASAMSNITPGIGGEGAARAYGSLQQARNVNMLRGIGIRIRGEDGSMKPMPQIVDEIWAKLNREKMGSEPITVQDVQISLQPGNALASMLDQYFGNDPLLRKQIEDGLMLKARSGGQRFAGKDLKKLGEKYGATTAAVSSISERTTQSMTTLQQVAPTMAAAFTFANRILGYMNGFFNLIDRFAGVLKTIGFFKGGGETISSGLGGAAGAAMNAAWAGYILKREHGGGVENKTPYVVGERGPELFVPHVDGRIVPNHELKNYPFRGDGGDVTAGGYTAKSWATELAKRLGAKKPTNEAIDALMTWMRFEGGHWVNSADFNPLNTTLGKKGAKSMNPVGVKAYTSWEQGFDATIDTLTGNKAKERGYTAIVEAIKKGNKEAILTAINNSAWRTGEAGGAGRYKGMLGSSGGSYGEGGRSGGTGASGEDTEDKKASKFSMANFLKTGDTTSRNLLSGFVKDFIGAAPAVTPNSTTYNYGGVTVNLSGVGNPEANVAALKAALSSQETIAKAAGN